MSVTVLVITGYGASGETECAHAARAAGADRADIAHFADILAGRVVIGAYNFLIFPGGASDGDDLGAAQAAAQRWKHAVPQLGAPLLEQLSAFNKNGGLILGIGNGFQLLLKLGLLPAPFGAHPDRRAALTHNASARFEDRWCRLYVTPESPCIFINELDALYLPVRHGEGRLVADAQTLARLRQEHLIPLCYADPETGLPTEKYPHNPSGSPMGIAGLCDPSGRIFGLMPHPEAYTHKANHPGWTRGESAPLGLCLFENAIAYLRG